jgi:hypothetical protein
MHRDRAHTTLALLAVVALVVGCGSAASSAVPDGQTAQPTTMPSASPAPTLPTPSAVIATPTAEPPQPVPTSTPTPAPQPPDPLAGKVVAGTVVVTVSDNLVVRSEPRVSADSTIYGPWLPLGTELTILGGPVAGSGYAWYWVAPVSFVMLDGPGLGWVAAASKDGEPWVAPAVRLDQVNDDATYAIAASQQSSYLAQTFTAGVTGALDSVQLLLDLPGSVYTQTATVRIESVANGIATGSVITEAAPVTLASNGWTAFTFPSPAQLLTGKQYAVVLVAPTPAWGISSDDPYAGGQAVMNGGAKPAQDFAFRTHVRPMGLVAGWPSVSGSGIEMTGVVESSGEPDGRLRLSVTITGLVPGESVTLRATGTYRVVWNCGVWPEPCGELGCGPTDWSETQGTTGEEAKAVAGSDGRAQARVEIAALQPGEACPSDSSFPWGAQMNEWAKVTVVDAAHGLLLTPSPIAWGYTF